MLHLFTGNLVATMTTVKGGGTTPTHWFNLVARETLSPEKSIGFVVS